MKKQMKSFLLILCLMTSLISAIMPTAFAATVSTDDLHDFASSAQQAIGSTAADLGLPSGDWCGYFVGNRMNSSQITAKLGTTPYNACAYAISLVSWICATKDAGVFYVASSVHQNRLLEIDPRLGSSGRMVARTSSGWTPLPGDILQFSWSNWNLHTFDHTGIVVSVDGDWLTYVDGNSSAGVVAAHTIRKDSSTIIGHIRFTVDRESVPSTPPEYFDCFVQINCFAGQTVNLYNNPGDTSRVDFFDKGQGPKSVYGAKLSDGSTWYRVNVYSLALNRNADLWLKYESNKMTVTDVPKSYMVHLDANGGYVSSKYMIVTDGEAFGSLLTPTRDGYTFDGWYTSASGGTQVTSSTVANSSYDESTLYAHWSTDPQATITGRFNAAEWIFSPSDGTLTVSGTGAFSLHSVAGFEVVPEMSDEVMPLVKHLVVKEGISKLMPTAFEHLPNLVSVKLPQSLETIGAVSFCNCTSLQEIAIPKNVSDIVCNAFQECSEFENIYVDSQNANYCSVDGILFTKDMSTLVQHCIIN